jgi:hypothetical protein
VIDLYWLPLGAGGHFVRWNGKVFEAFAAALARRERTALVHSALEIVSNGSRYVVEQAPAWGERGERGVVGEGPVGARPLGHLRMFRYEIRRWRDGVIPDRHEAMASPVRVSDDAGLAAHVLELVPLVPRPVWGRDELGAGEMWNSNSIISWLLTRAGIDAEAISPPLRARAPGWRAGIVVARRQQLRRRRAVSA